MDIGVVVVAAGRGLRAGIPDTRVPKQYRVLGGQPVLERTLRIFLDHPRIGRIVSVIRDADMPEYSKVAGRLDGSRIGHVIGGATRQISVRAGLEALEAKPPRGVLIHDGVRPFVSAALIDQVIDALESADAALPAVPVTDTLKRASGGLIGDTVDRNGLVRAQTPQGFRFDKILGAHRAAHRAGREDFTDDAQTAQWHGLDVALVAGDEANVKLTTAEDFELAERMMSSCGRGEWRNGHGYDVHRFGAGDHVMLCGVRVPHDQGLEGHSDADVGLHALTDALLGALGEGDIGTHFPPSEPKWAGAGSDIFLADAARRLGARSGRIVNVDVTLICEYPKIGAHREDMCRKIADILDISSERVSVKATTTEGLGFTGRGEGIAAHASASIWIA